MLNKSRNARNRGIYHSQSLLILKITEVLKKEGFLKLKVKARVLVPQLKKKRGITKFDDCEAKDSDFKSKDKSFVRYRD